MRFRKKPCVARNLSLRLSSRNSEMGMMISRMAQETELKRDAPLKNLYQKAQASLVFSLFSKLPSSKTHPLNTLKDKYLSPTIDSDMGLRMYILVLLSRMFNHDREGLVYLKQVQLARLAELLFIAFEIHGCILEPSTAKTLDEKHEIEDGNRLSVIAGDFLMAAASSQLAEIENQIVVDQISKSIADISSGTLQELPVLCSEQEWLKAKLQRDVSLVKRAAWSTITLQKDQIMEEQLIADDVPKHCGQFAADLMFLKVINEDIAKYTSGQTEAQNLLPTLYDSNGLSRANVLSAEVYDRCKISLAVLPDCQEKKIFQDYITMLIYKK